MEPKTEAGRGLLDWYAPADNEHDPERAKMGAAIANAEAEAAALAEARSSDLLRQYRDALERLVAADMEKDVGEWVKVLDEARALLAAEVASSDAGMRREVGE